MKTYTKTIEAPRLVIEHDSYSSSPRSDTNLGYFITCESKYVCPDDEEELKSLIQNAGDESNSQEEHIKKIKEEMPHNGYGKVLYITPVYRYEHGNVVYRRGTQHGFDSSNCGFYIITDKTHAEMPEEEKEWERIIDSELELYTSWANGEVYRFTLYDEHGEEEDSCGGFYGVEDIRESLPDEWKEEKLEDYIKN